MVMAKNVKDVMSVCELTVRFEERRVTPDSLIEQIYRLQEIGCHITIKANDQKNGFGAAVEIEGGKIDGRWT